MRFSEYCIISTSDIILSWFCPVSLSVVKTVKKKKNQMEDVAIKIWTSRGLLYSVLFKLSICADNHLQFPLAAVISAFIV